MAAALLPAADSCLGRTWTSADGAYTVEAEFVEQSDTAVKLRKQDGRVVVVPFAQLSRADREYLAGLARRAGGGRTGDGEPAPGPAGGDAAAAKKLLEDKGLIVTSVDLRLPDEQKLTEGLKKISRDRFKLTNAAKQLEAARAQVDATRQKITQLTRINVQLNARLATIAPNDVTMNNRLVGMLNANDGQIQLLQQGLEKLEEQQRTVRAGYNEVREQYVQQILDLRVLANGINSQYTKLATDGDVRKAVATLNNATGKTYEVAAGRTYLSADRRLKQLEDTVLSETINLRLEGSDSWWVPVVINGQHTKEMIIDSGASIVALPHELALACGLEPSSQAPTITLILADGRPIQAKGITIDSLRVGKFTVEKVECGVLGPEAVAAEPLLGMSFLREFKFELNTQKRTLTMVKVDEGGGSRKQY